MPSKDRKQQDQQPETYASRMRVASGAYDFKELLKEWLLLKMKPPTGEKEYMEGNHPAELTAYRQGWNGLAHIIIRDALTDKEANND